MRKLRHKRRFWHAKIGFRSVSDEIEVERKSSVVNKDLDKMYLFGGDERGVAGEVCQILSEHFNNGQQKSNCPKDPIPEEVCFIIDKFFENKEGTTKEDVKTISESTGIEEKKIRTYRDNKKVRMHRAFK